MTDPIVDNDKPYPNRPAMSDRTIDVDDTTEKLARELRQIEFPGAPEWGMASAAVRGRWIKVAEHTKALIHRERDKALQIATARAHELGQHEAARMLRQMRTKETTLPSEETAFADRDASRAATHLPGSAPRIGSPDTPAEAAARAWLHSYGINTARYVDGAGGDHPAMRSLPQAFEDFARSQKETP